MNTLPAEWFSYDVLDPTTAIFVRTKVTHIRVRLRQTVTDIVEIGQAMIDVKDRLPHGMFLPWLRSEFSMSERTAENFMNVANMVGDKSANFADIPISALYLLASPSTPDDVKEIFVSGEIEPTTKAIRQAIKARKQTDGKHEDSRNVGSNEQDGDTVTSLVDTILSSPWSSHILKKNFIPQATDDMAVYLDSKYDMSRAVTYARAFRTIATLLDDVADWLEE